MNCCRSIGLALLVGIMLTGRPSVAQVPITPPIAPPPPVVLPVAPPVTVPVAGGGYVCETAAAVGGETLLPAVCAGALGICVGYGLYKGIEYCWDPLGGPVGIDPPPVPPKTKEGCVFQRSICDSNAEKDWDDAYDACKAQFPNEYSDGFDNCMQVHDQNLQNEHENCEDQYNKCIAGVVVMPLPPINPTPLPVAYPTNPPMPSAK